MRRYWGILGALLLVIVISCKEQPTSLTGMENPVGKDNIAYYWGKVALEATANDTEKFKPRPTITSRYLALIFVAVFDAWAKYDENATAVYATDIPKANEEQHTLLNKEIAISYAAYYTLKEYYYSDSLLLAEKMRLLGLDPTIEPEDSTSPAAIGIQVAKQVIEQRKGDGSNQYGEEEGSNGTPYLDYTHYEPVNSVDSSTDINRWQPKYFSDGRGGAFAPGCLTPFWQHVEPITLESADQFRSGPPPYYGSEQLEKEVAEVVELQSNLTPEQKALVEFMRDGPKSVQQAGHWLIFAQDVSVRDQHDLDTDVKMYFLNQITAMDAFIASWDTKMYYDYARPYALVHKYFEGIDFYGWAGYEEGWKTLKGEQWRPYSPETFLCPPFPSYVSGHSTISGACSEALKLFTDSDEFGIEVPFVAGSFTEPEEEWKEVVLKFPTFTQTADMAGISRVLGGYHIQADNIEGLELGRKVAHHSYQFYLEHVGVK